MEIVSLKKTIDSEKDYSTEVIRGLRQKEKKISSKFFYDDIGSDLFTQITQLDEYYLTRSEKEIFDTYVKEIVNLFGNKPINLIELGAGDGQKTILLLKEMMKRGLDFIYSPIDISLHALEVLKKRVSKEVPDIKFRGVLGDYTEGLSFISEGDNRRNICLFLGSNIGNFSVDESINFLSTLRKKLSRRDALLIGMDLIKDPKALLPAYKDELKVTEKFNKNVLSRFNRELRANFDLESFDHYAHYCPKAKAMESYLWSLKDQEVAFSRSGEKVYFYKGEFIHMECSHKYDDPLIKKIINRSGLKDSGRFYDKKERYLNIFLTV